MERKPRQHFFITMRQILNQLFINLIIFLKFHLQIDDNQLINNNHKKKNPILPLSVNYLQVPSSSAVNTTNFSTGTLSPTSTISNPSSSTGFLSLASVVAAATAASNAHQAANKSNVISSQSQRSKISGWNRFMVPKHSPSTIISTSLNSTVTGNNISSSSTTTTATTPYSMTPSYYNTGARVSDLRRILNPEVEKEDSFKKFSDAVENCECFEFNLNNAAKIITAVVLLATFILVVKSLKGDR